MVKWCVLLYDVCCEELYSVFLKKIIFEGFKSFVDWIEFDFGDGIIGIVGLNGCGKSNVVDVVCWVFGE